jgi:DNA (cytosine-5)-methyltransferase 1
MTNAAFRYNWSIASGYPAAGIPAHRCKVFGTFICGGGSTMGYKLAGYNHLGGVEIDLKIADVYQSNHSPRLLYRDDIRAFIERTDLPPELYDLDILDGSPPCSSFSMAGNREEDWGKEKTFREGQALQRLDDLFFDYIRLGEKLRPKVIIAENVSGLVAGNAKAYVHEIAQELQRIGYRVQLFHLNAATMGVPQKRERVFFVCLRNDLQLPKLQLSFTGKPILYGKIASEVADPKGAPLTEAFARWWRVSKPGHPFSNAHPRGSFFNSRRLGMNQVVYTITSAAASRQCCPDTPHEINDAVYSLAGTFPRDYNYCGIEPKYILGMSVPPVMMANLSYQVYLQWLSRLN